MDENILFTIRNGIIKHKLFAHGDGLVLGVSGGADSVCLLSVFKELQNEFNLKLTAVHVNHGLRGEESDSDQRFTEALCKHWDVPVKIFQVNIRAMAKARGFSLEEAGREARYEVFNRVLQETGSSRIAVAHHRDDQAETVMLNILRGTGLDGLCGMRPIQGNIIRPLIHISRDQILDYLSDRGIPYRTDSSNLKDDYSRNRVRNLLFPAMREMFKINPANQIIRMSELVSDDRDYLDSAAHNAFLDVLHTDNPEIVALRLPVLKSLHPALIKRIIRLAWERISGNRKNLEQVHVEQIMNLCHNGHTGKKVPLPNGIEARLSYDRLIFSHKEIRAEKSFCYKVDREGTTVIKEADGQLAAEVLPACEAFEKYGCPKAIKDNSLTQLFDLDRLEGDVVVRSRRYGDRIRPRGMNGEKKLKEFFIDQKVPQEDRSGIPLVALGSKVAWVVGMRTSDDFRAREDTQRVWVLSWRYLHDGGEQK